MPDIQLYVSADCIGCVTQVIGFKEQSDMAGSLHLTNLSDHAGRYDMSWRGRLRNAWWCLKGSPRTDVMVESRSEAIALSNAIMKAARELWPDAATDQEKTVVRPEVLR